MLPRYAGKVNCIYIDPPYNTGNEGWVYNDNVKAPLLSDWYADESPVDGEDLERHDKWLCMMWPRLQLLRELLAENGAILLSIDNNEVHHLRLMLDEIFGADNFLAEISWWSKHTLANDAKGISDQHESILFYSRSAPQFRVRLLPRSEQMDMAYDNPDSDPRGRWMASPLHAKSGRESDRYSVMLPNGVTWACPPGRFPVYNQDRLLELYAEGRLWFGRSGTATPSKKTYLSEVRQGKTVGSLWEYSEVGHTAGARNMIKTIFADRDDPFDNPKPVDLIRRAIWITTGNDGIILDSFAGSGTTAQATLALNDEDGGTRRFILVELEDYANTITAERVRRVIKGVPEIKDQQLRDGLGGSFTYCTLGEPLDLETMLRGDSLPPYAELAAYLLYTATGISIDGAELKPRDDGWFFGDDGTDYYLFYEPDLEWLQSNEAVFTEDQAKRIRAAESGCSAVVFAAGKFIGQRELSKMNITFCQLPYELHRAGG